MIKFFEGPLRKALWQVFTIRKIKRNASTRLRSTSATPGTYRRCCPPIDYNMSLRPSSKRQTEGFFIRRKGQTQFCSDVLEKHTVRSKIHCNCSALANPISGEHVLFFIAHWVPEGGHVRSTVITRSTKAMREKCFTNLKLPTKCRKSEHWVKWRN